MTKSEETFLDIYSKSLAGKPAEEDIFLKRSPFSTYRELLSLAERHRVFPMVFDALYSGAEHAERDAFAYRKWLKKAQYLTCYQARASAEFLKLYSFLGKKGLFPIVMKGIICRNLYPNPEQRSSSDEDLLISEKDFERYHRALLEYGMRIHETMVDTDSTSEISYYNHQVYIELHKTPFPPDSKAYGDLNQYFQSAEERKVQEIIYGVPVYTMAPTDHILYQLCHAYKHFLNCGIGIRQVSDIVLFSIVHENEIDWEYILSSCSEVNMRDFAAAVFKIGEQYLFCERFPELLRKHWQDEELDEKPLLHDILDGGIYGTSSYDRLHSSNITLRTMESEKNGAGRSSFARVLFPDLSSMRQRYSYLSGKPYLLPAAWVHRLSTYFISSVLQKKQGNNVSEAIKIGNERVKLMRRYKIIGDNTEEGALKRLYKRSHQSVLAPFLSICYRFICALEYASLNLYWILQGFRKPDENEIREVGENVTFIVKSFERQRLAKGLCRNIAYFYPGVRIIIADDSKNPLRINQRNVQVLSLPFNSGLSAGLQAALNEVRTPYVMRMDDDELLTRKSLIHRELRFLMNHPELDLLGFGHMTAIRLHSPEFNFSQYYSSSMEDAPCQLRIPHMTRLDERHLVLGKVANIYLARTEGIKTVGFDPNIKVIDHHDFFWRAAGKLVSAAVLDTVVFHRHNPYNRHYNRFRSDYQTDLEYIREKRAQRKAKK